MTTISSSVAAKTICEISSWTITHLQIHKLLYIVDMAKLNAKRERLIDEDFEAWRYGPVLPSLYQKLKFHYNHVIKDVWPDTKSLKKGDENYDLMYSYGIELSKLSARQLINLTHKKDSAWIKYYLGNKESEPKIPDDAMLKEYRSLVGLDNNL